ncbi:MAG TPA: hypothetical protein VK601_04350, partial [Kofleriaceae bacterium]|nr:hypothetical protein [Kofleriaceae bacterium]
MLVSAVVVSCAAGGPSAGQQPASGPVGVDPDEAGPEFEGGQLGGASGVPDVRCDDDPDAGRSGRFRHLKNIVISKLGDPRHRGLDLVGSADGATQRLEGWISYTVIDKALEDEDVDVFACRAGPWRRIGTARTDDDGHFALALTGA